ncbi:MAG: glutamyl-tRNA reductase, partial [Proteobacteria bacterium]|nr:glutamyl-tRNA reductase [Pseudomonadota bacterium]
MSQLMAVGLNHRTAPVEVRERLALDETGISRQLKRLVDDGVCEEALLLSTCNRVELYAVPNGESRMRSYMSEFRGPRGEPLAPYLYWLKGREAVQHLFHVTSSLDSQVIGEPQILGQVKDALRLAEDSRAVGKVLHKLIHRSFFVAKRIRTETEIGRNRVGVGNAGVDLATQVFGPLKGRRALLVGAGEMGREVARGLLSAGLCELLVANRTWDKAIELASVHRGTAVPYERVVDYLARVDIVIVATGARTPILGRQDVQKALRTRRYRWLVLIDLSVPRNIAPEVDDLNDAFLFNVDDLSQVVSQGRQAREAASAHAEDMVREETDRFLQAMAEVDADPHIGLLTRRMEDIRQDELDRSRRLLEGLDDSQKHALDA